MVLAVPAPGAGKPVGAGRGAGPAAAFLDLMQELAATGDSEMPANLAAEGDTEPATAHPSSADAPAQPKRGSRGAAAVPQARTPRQTGVGETDSLTSLGLAPLPVPGAESKRHEFAISGSVALANSGGTATAPGDADTAEGSRTGIAAIAGAVPADDASPSRDRAATGQPPVAVETQASAGLVIPSLAPELETSAAAAGTGALDGKSRPEESANQRESSETPPAPVEVGRQSKPAPQPTATSARISLPNLASEESVNQWKRSETLPAAAPLQPGRQSKPAPPSTEANGTQTGADASALPANDGATPADRAGSQSGLTNLPAPAMDLSGVAAAQLLQAGTEAGSQQAPAPTAGDPGQPQPAAELAFAARLSPASDRVRRTGGAEGASLDSGGGQDPEFVPAAPGSPSGVPSQEAAGAQADAAPTPAPGPSPATTIRNAPGTSEPAGPVAHDIKLELSGAGPRVEVRLVERAGEVHVAVRTPDGRLAEAMRDDLPALAARLEQSGFHGNEWRTGAAGGGQRTVEIGRTGGAREFQEDPGGRGQQQPGQDEGQERQRPPAPPAGSRNKEFASLISSLRGTREEK